MLKYSKPHMLTQADQELFKVTKTKITAGAKKKSGSGRRIEFRIRNAQCPWSNVSLAFGNKMKS